VSVYIQLERNRADLEANAENQARTARVLLDYESAGHGEIALADPVGFDVTFLEEPRVVTGVVLASGQLLAGKFPQVTAGVHRWVRDARGLWTGAYLFFVVDASNQPYRLRHHLTFEGVAIKLADAQFLAEIEVGG